MHGFQPTHHDRSPRSDRICRRPKDLVVFCWQLMFSTPPSWKDAGPPIGSSTHIGIFRSKMLETSNLLLLSSWKWWNAASLRSSCDTFVRTIQLKLCLFFNVCVFAETRTLKSSALLVFVWKPPHLLLDNKCFESSLWNHKTTRKPKWDREDERIKNLRNFPQQTVSACASYVHYHVSPQWTEGRWIEQQQPWQLKCLAKNWKHLLLKEKVDQRWRYPMIPQ